jgi:undecaprenyl-diphosphatase
VCLAAADQISSGIIKEVVGRLRPSHNPDFEGIIHLVNNRKSGQFGFVSSHAANTLGFALLCTLFFKNKIFSTIIFAWAIINCYTRIYLGLHYPLDIIGGSIVGFAVAIIIFSICKRFVKLQTNLSIKQLFIPIAVLAVTILTIIVYSAFG